MLRRLLPLLRKLRELDLDIPWDVLLNLDFSVLFDLLKLPDFSDEAAFRAWCIQLADAADQLADLTATERDDDLARLVRAICASDEAWTAFYGLLTGRVKVGSPGEPVAADVEPILAALDDLKIDAATIIMIITAILEIIQFFRDRKAEEAA